MSKIYIFLKSSPVFMDISMLCCGLDVGDEGLENVWVVKEEHMEHAGSQG